MELGYRPGKWNINANYTYTKGRTTSLYSESGTALTRDTTYNNLYRVPEHALNLFAGYQAGPKLSFSTIARYAGSRLEPLYASAPEELDPYFTIDLSGFYKFNDHFKAFAEFRNITNQEYFDVWGYNARPFHFNLGLDIQF